MGMDRARPEQPAILIPWKAGSSRFEQSHSVRLQFTLLCAVLMGEGKPSVLMLDPVPTSLQLMRPSSTVLEVAQVGG